VSLYFIINSVLTITIFPNIVIFIITENYMLQSFFQGLSVYCPFFLGRCLIDQGSFWRRVTLSVLFRLKASSHPGFPFSPFSFNVLSSEAIAKPSPVCVLVPPFSIFLSKLLTSRKIARWRCKLFFVTGQRSAQVMNLVNRGPTQEKNNLLLAGIEPRSHSCEPNVLPLDHGLPLT
jgi:hypothetical protein